MSTIAEIERCSVRAVPAVESVGIEGWHLAIGRGQVMRMNSVTTFGVIPWEPIETIEQVERRYAARSRPCWFRLTELDAQVEDLLFARGYERCIDVIVMTAGAIGDPDAEVTMLEAVTPGWAVDLGRLSGSSDLRTAEIAESLSALTLRHGAFRLGDHAVGLAVMDPPWVGLFDLAVDPDHRRRGLGARISRAMLEWAGGLGAERAYLQVTADNTPAIRLYQHLGFEERYRYWYRMKPEGP